MANHPCTSCPRELLERQPTVDSILATPPFGLGIQEHGRMGDCSDQGEAYHKAAFGHLPSRRHDESSHKMHKDKDHAQHCWICSRQPGTTALAFG